MPNHPTIIAAVDLNGDAPGIVRRAAKLAARCHGRLVITHVVDHRPGYESDQLPVVAATEVEGQMVRYAHAWLRGLAHHLELPRAELAVSAGSLLENLVTLAQQLQPQYVVVGRSRWAFLSRLAGLSPALDRIANGCDVLVVARSADSVARNFSRRAGEWLSSGSPLTPKAAQ